jgi:drug/metabolite transporter (DMT)-like permease
MRGGIEIGHAFSPRCLPMTYRYRRGGVAAIRLVPGIYLFKINAARRTRMAGSAGLLGEQVDIRRWAAVGVGFCGVLIALRPSAGVFGGPAAIALASSVAFAFMMVVTRSLRGTPDILLASMQFTGTFVFGLVALPFGWLTPSPRDLGLFMLVGGLAVVASLSVNRSLKLAPASIVVPYQYSMIIWAAIFGYLVFADVPSMATIAGAAIIIGAGLYIFLRERNLGREDAIVSPPA